MDILSRRLDYEVQSKTIKLILGKRGDKLYISEAIEENELIIYDYYNSKIVEYLRNLENIKKDIVDY